MILLETISIYYQRHNFTKKSNSKEEKHLKFGQRKV